MESEVKLKKLTKKIGSGSTPRGGKGAYLASGKISLIRSQNIYNHFFKKEGLVYITEDQADKLKNVEVQDKDVLINITGDSIARCMVIREGNIPARVNQHVSIIRCDFEKLDPFYLLAWLTSSETQKYLLSIGDTGGTRAALTKKMLEDLYIPVIDIRAQKKIGDILNAINSKIETNNKIMHFLEEIAETLFKRWFVDFEFPDEYGEPYKSNGGKMKESDLGIIPLKWHVDTLPNISTVIYGKAFKSKFFNEDKEGMPLIRIRNIPNNFSDLFTTEDYEERYLINEKDILIGMDGEFNVSIWKGESSVQNQRVLKINSNYLPQLYLYFALKRPIEEIEFGKVGTTVIHLSKRDIDSIKIRVPDPRLIDLITVTFGEIIDLIVLQEKENAKLKDIRDTLLPKLLSGEIELPDETEVTEHVPIP